MNTTLRVQWKVMAKNMLTMIDNEKIVSEHAIRGVTLALEMELYASSEVELENTWDKTLLELNKPKQRVVKGSDFVGHEARRQADGFEILLQNKKLHDKLKEFVKL